MRLHHYLIAFVPGVLGAQSDLLSNRLVDLTHSLNAQTLYWPTSPSTFKLERLSYGRTEGGWFYSANSFSAPEHGGTHLDAPIHFAEGRNTSDKIPIEQLIGRAVVIDISAKAAADAACVREAIRSHSSRNDCSSQNRLEQTVVGQEALLW
jgi:kynurenine formamidase